MKKSFAAALLAASAVIGLSLTPASAEVVYLNSGGVWHTLDNDTFTTQIAPTSVVETTEFGEPTFVERTLINSAVMEPMTTTRVLTSPQVIQTQPVLIDRVERDRGHLLHLNLFPLVDFSLF